MLNIEGIENSTHFPSPCRTMYADVNPANNITMLTIPNHNKARNAFRFTSTSES